MQKRQDAIQDKYGNAIAFAVIKVFAYPSNAAVTIYSDDGVTPIPNSTIVADDKGTFSYYRPTARYNEFYYAADGVTPLTPASQTDVQADYGYQDASAVLLAASSGSSLVGFLQAGTGAVAETVYLNLTRRVYPEQFGAVGDGVADDTAAINAAYTKLAGNNRGGWLVLTPGKQYKTTAALSILSDYIRTVGEGGIILPSGAANCFEVGPNNQTRQNVIFDGVIVQHGASVLDIVSFLGGTHLCKVMNCWFEGSTGIYNASGHYGVNFQGGIQFNNDCRVQGNFFRWLQKGIKDGAQQVNLNIDTNRFANLNNTAIEISSGGVSRMQSNNFEICCAGQTTAPVILIGNGGAPTIGRVILEDSHFENNGGTALNGNLDVKINGARTVRLLGNRFFSGATYPCLKAIRSDTCNGLVVDGNEYDSYSSGAVDIPSGVNNSKVVYFGNTLVSGAEFAASGSNGITLMANTSGNWSFSLGDAAGADAFVIKDSNGTNLLIADSAGNLKGPSGNSLNIKLGDAAGANALAVKDSSGNNVALAFSNGNLRITGALGVGNSAAATTPGSVVKKIEVFNASGTSLGFIPVYSSIT